MKFIQNQVISIIVNITLIWYMFPLSFVKSSRLDMKCDESAMTAVIEFLSAFVLFLMLVTAFLSLAQLQLGPNTPDIDRLERSAVEAIERLTGSSGYHIPFENGTKDIGNATEDWHLLSPEELNSGALIPGLLSERGRLSVLKVNSLNSLTEDTFSKGLGLNEEYDLRLLVRIEKSPNQDRIGQLLFDDGTHRNDSFSSVSISRTLHMDDEIVLVSLEVHLGAGYNDRLYMTEIMIEPNDGGPEWIELHNLDQFAINLSGWSISRLSNGIIEARELITTGVVPGGSYLILSGNPAIQVDTGSSVIFDLGTSGVLGSGQINLLNPQEGQILFQYAEFNSALSYDMINFRWDSNWNINEGYSLVWNENDIFNSSSWIPLEFGTPGSM
ncbi:MAG: hypothetical protein CMB56_001350 [Methanobacteriota archaeon]|nr:MAG: hypothetical protein CMB56_001350 [Euryarchaeota archaeon]|tara:strand:- start:4516 stop:5670 length:1155 start_codon:yes stop_codon:yes gene_type:complete